MSARRTLLLAALATLAVAGVLGANRTSLPNADATGNAMPVLLVGVAIVTALLVRRLGSHRDGRSGVARA